MGNGKQGDIVIDFIDPLFAVVLHISFVEIMTKPWFSEIRLVIHSPYLFHLGTLILAYTTIINSWIGYHQSIKKNPINVDSFGHSSAYLLLRSSRQLRELSSGIMDASNHLFCIFPLGPIKTSGSARNLPRLKRATRRNRFLAPCFRALSIRS
jgi:hypothetical protein